MQISIHVPAWGTTNGREADSDTGYFNPRARVGHDVDLRPASSAIVAFQSTCPRGARPGYNPVVKTHINDFNPRARVGHDSRDRLAVQGRIFQSTCPRGARPGPDDSVQKVPLISIHVPAWGTTWDKPAPTVVNVKFQSTCPRGARPAAFPRSWGTVISIHVPAWGTTWLGYWRPDTSSYFNPRARVGHDGVVHHQVRQHFISIHVPAWGTTS